MIPINEAVKIAEQTLLDLVPQAESVLLEEAEMSDENQWLITLSFPDPNAANESFLGGVYPRKYKSFAIDAESGIFKAMRMRHV